MATGKRLLKESEKPRKEKKKSVSKLKKELDTLFSKYIRLKYANQVGQVSCFTCEKTGNWKDMQCGHFISRVYLATRFDERNVRVQCIGCNIFGNGKNVEFARKLEIQDKAIVKELYKKAQQIVIKYPYEEKIKEYKEKLILLEQIEELH